MIIFDVGANDGNSCFHYSHNSSNIVYAFEPTPRLINDCLNPKRRNNYIVVPYAISDFDGESTFNIAGQADWGCSSLHEFEDNLDETWPGRWDFKVTEKITVPVKRMDTFIKENNIEKIDFMHCDTQGNDLTVLQSFGEYISILESGVVECANKNPLYKQVDNSLESVKEFLEKNNFDIVKIETNDIQDNEMNIHFKKKV